MMYVKLITTIRTVIRAEKSCSETAKRRYYGFH